MNTPINLYAHPTGMDLEEFLEMKARIAAKQGKTIKILDVGCGHATQWVEFLKRHPNVEWHGSSLSKTVKHSLKEKVRLCHAGNLHAKFEPESFDYVVSHLGFHDQPKDMLENTLHVLKPGGEAFLVNALQEIPFHEAKNHFQEFHVLKQNWSGEFWGARIRKEPTPAITRILQTAKQFLQDKGILKKKVPTLKKK